MGKESEGKKKREGGRDEEEGKQGDIHTERR
jgi:hypothetical protein